MQENGFLYVHTPIITASDCEGAGEMFQVGQATGAACDPGPQRAVPGRCHARLSWHAGGQGLADRAALKALATQISAVRHLLKVYSG